jgi:hypothetical protein
MGIDDLLHGISFSIECLFSLKFHVITIRDDSVNGSLTLLIDALNYANNRLLEYLTNDQIHQ